MTKKIIDAFTFNNEFDMLKLRLYYLNDFVDYFIITESNYTYSGKLKPYYLDEIIDTLPDFIKNKIIRLKYEPDISTLNFSNNLNNIDYNDDAWKLEYGQRNFVTQNLSQFSLDDIIMVSDIDEIPNRNIIKDINFDSSEVIPHVSKCKMFYYNFHTFLHDNWLGTVFSTVDYSIKNGYNNIRNSETSKNLQFIPIENGGWHFSYFMDIENIKYKIESFAHREYNNDLYNNTNNITTSINEKKYLFDHNYKFTEYDFSDFPEDIKETIIEYFPKQYYTKIYIFGSNGMLGSYLKKYLENYFQIISITRNEINLLDDFSLINEKYKFNSFDVIINAAGIIKQRDYNVNELIKVNSLFPHFLSEIGCNVIHITTDCVFSGKDGSYNEDFHHDCLDDYGKSKSLGENNSITVIRTSIIGEEIFNKKSLLEWVRNNRYKEINGYLNHFWNGVTCLELSKHILNIIETNSYWKGVRHYYSPDTVSKYQLVSYINEIYKLNNYVNPVMSEYCDRSLSTKYHSPITKTIKEQIIETKEYGLFSLLVDKKNKLNNLPTINFISLIDNENRRKFLYEMFEEYEISKVRPHIFEKFDENKDIILNMQDILNSQAYKNTAIYSDISKYFGALTSHLKAIKEWYDNTDEPYAIFCEDDISFDTVQFWNFTWSQFFDILPENWRCIQLSLSRDDMFLYFQPHVYLRSRCWDDFSCACYLINREHAKNLLENYYDGNYFTLKYVGIDEWLRPQLSKDPTIETLIYSIFLESSVFSFPLFVENNHFHSTVWFNRVDAEQSSNIILNWWKETGRYFNINNFSKIH